MAGPPPQIEEVQLVNAGGLRLRLDAAPSVLTLRLTHGQMSELMVWAADNADRVHRLEQAAVSAARASEELVATIAGLDGMIDTDSDVDGLTELMESTTAQLEALNVERVRVQDEMRVAAAEWWQTIPRVAEVWSPEDMPAVLNMMLMDRWKDHACADPLAFGVPMDATRVG